MALGLALGIQALIVKPYRIPSGSMEPTLAVGQRVLVNRIGMDFSDPHVGEIAVFHPPRGRRAAGRAARAARDQPGGAACAEPEPEAASVNFIKRVVAGPGDEIYIREGHVFRKAPASRSSCREGLLHQTVRRAARSATSRRRSRFRPATGS